jgi:hypothetical protein
MKSIPFLIVIIGAIVGGILGTIAMLFWYVSSGEYMGVMVGSGLGCLIVVPIASFVLGGVPGAVLGGLIGLVLGILGIQVKELL